MKPPAAHGIRRGRRLLPVALHYAIATSDNFAHGFSVSRHVVVIGIHDSEFDAGDGISGHRLTHKALFSFPAEPGFH